MQCRIRLDWPLVAMRPRFVVLAGTERLAGYKDYGFHPFANLGFVQVEELLLTQGVGLLSP